MLLPSVTTNYGITRPRKDLVTLCKFCHVCKIAYMASIPHTFTEGKVANVYLYLIIILEQYVTLYVYYVG